MFALTTSLFSGNASLWERLSEWYRESAIKAFLDAIEEQFFSVDIGTYENFSVSSGLGATVQTVVLALMVAIIISSILTARTRIGLGGFVRTLLAQDCLSPDRAKTLSELGYFCDAAVRRDLDRGGVLRMVVCRADEALEAPVADEGAVADETVVLASETADLTVAEHAEALANDQVSIEENASTEVVEKVPTNWLERLKNATRIAFLAKNDRKKIDFLTARFYIPEDLKYRAEVRFEQKGSGWGGVVIVSVLAVVAASAICFFLPELLQLADNFITLLAP